MTRALLAALVLTVARVAAAPLPYLENFSASALVAGTSAPLTCGFTVGGPSPKALLVRADGPSLAAFGVAGVLKQPVLAIVTDSGLVSTDAGLTTSFAASVGAFPFSAGSADQAAAIEGLTAGSQSFQILGGPGASGVALGEIFDADGDASTAGLARLVNFSASGQVGTHPLVAGFVVRGGTLQVLVRAIGPTLAQFGVSQPLADPAVTLFAANGGAIASNQHWSAAPANVGAAFASAGAFPLPLGSADSAILISLGPGAYTAQVSSASGGSGTALAEIYVVP